MWISLHIYNYKYEDFLAKLKILEDKYQKNDIYYFFTIYSDISGPHYRLRIKNKSNISFINSLFGFKNIEENIYDPENLKYKNNLRSYEDISVYFCKYLVRNYDYIIKQKSIFCLALASFLNNYLGTNSIIHYERAIKFWKNSFSLFSKQFFLEGNINQLVKNVEESHIVFFKDLKKMLRTFSLENREELAFHLTHMFINRMNFTPKDEIYIYATLIKWEENLKE